MAAQATHNRLYLSTLKSPVLPLLIVHTWFWFSLPPQGSLGVFHLLAHRQRHLGMLRPSLLFLKLHLFVCLFVVYGEGDPVHACLDDPVGVKG